MGCWIGGWGGDLHTFSTLLLKQNETNEALEYADVCISTSFLHHTVFLDVNDAYLQEITEPESRGASFVSCTKEAAHFFFFVVRKLGYF